MKNNDQKGVISLPALLFVLFLGLKLAGFIDWSWWGVFASLWIPACIALLILIVLAIFKRSIGTPIMRSKYIEQQLKEIDETPAYHIKGRKEIFTKQLLEWGFHDGHTFDLCDHLAELILPRLKRYKELASTVIKIDFPLDDMINAFDIIAHKEYLSWTDEEKKIVEKGLRAFADYYMCLWW